MTDPVVARRATADDLPAVLRLATNARDESHDERGGRLLFELTHASVAQSTRYDDVLAHDEQALFVGEVTRSVVGYATAHVEQGESLRICAIDELFVHPQARSVGVGAALLHQTQEWARANGCTHVESQVLPGNRAAKNFFERVGMVTRAMRVSAPLDES